MMLSAKLDQCAAFFALPENAPAQQTTENHQRPADRQRPTRPAAACERSALFSAERQDGRKHRQGSTSLKRSRHFSIHHDAKQQQDSSERKVRFDLTQNEVRECRKKAPPSLRAKQSRVGATWGAHHPGVNDYMSGSLVSSATAPHRCASRSHLLRITDDQTVAWFGLDVAVEAMPFKIVSTVDLRALNIFEDPFPDDIIGDDFQTTYLGIQRAIEDAEDAMRYENHGELSYDEILVGELAWRAGLFPGVEKVEYVENMVPIIGEGDGNFDEEYWVMVWGQGAIWDQLSGATKEAIAERNTVDAADDETMS